MPSGCVTETPEGTSRTETRDGVQGPSPGRGTSETPEGTSHIHFLRRNVQTDVVSVELDARDLKIPFDMIIGRPSICEHRLLRFDAQLSRAGFDTQIMWHTQLPLNSGKEPPLAPVARVEAGPKGFTSQSLEI